MKQFIARILFLSPLLFIGWSITALLTWIGLFASMPGYYQWFIEQPINQGFNSLQLTILFASGVASLLSALTSLSLATFLFLRKPGDRGALFVSFYLLIYGFIMAGPFEMIEYLVLGQTGAISIRAQAIIFTAPAIILLLVFPNGIFTPAWSRSLIPFILLLALVMGVLPLRDIYSLDSIQSKIAYGYSGILLICGLGAQAYRYTQKSSPVERQQTKIVLYGIFVQFLLFFISSIEYMQSDPLGKPSPEMLVSSITWWVALAALPIAFTLSVIRSHLWDIDVVIRRTLIYGILTSALALIYLGSVVLLQPAAQLIIGHESPVAVVLSTLTVAGLFHPLRRSIQTLIDRRFFRSKYNSEKALARFQNGLRYQVNLESVESEITHVLQETVQPEWLSLWILDSTIHEGK